MSRMLSVIARAPVRLRRPRRVRIGTASGSATSAAAGAIVACASTTTVVRLVDAVDVSGDEAVVGVEVAALEQRPGAEARQRVDRDIGAGRSGLLAQQRHRRFDRALDGGDDGDTTCVAHRAGGHRSVDPQHGRVGGRRGTLGQTADRRARADDHVGTPAFEGLDRVSDAALDHRIGEPMAASRVEQILPHLVHGGRVGRAFGDEPVERGDVDLGGVQEPDRRHRGHATPRAPLRTRPRTGGSRPRRRRPPADAGRGRRRRSRAARRARRRRARSRRPAPACRTGRDRPARRARVR